MATYPNNYRSGVGFNPNSSYYGIMPLFAYNAELGTGAGSRLNWLIGDQGGGFAKTASAPDGYGMKTPFPPLKAGSMSAWNDPVAQLAMTGNMLQGGPMEGTGTITFDQSGGLSLTVGMAGTATVVTITGDGNELRLTIGLDGTGTMEFTGTSGLSMVVPFAGTGTVAELIGTSDLKGNLDLSGEWTPFTELSPEGLATAVWQAVATSYNDAGTMGAKLNSAASGGVDYTALAAAVLAAAQTTPIHSDFRKALGYPIAGTGVPPTFDINGVQTDPGDPLRLVI